MRKLPEYDFKAHNPMTRYFCIMLFALIFAGSAAAAESTAPETLNVGIKPAPPFVIGQKEGERRGISVALWQDVADKLGVKTHYVPSDLSGMFSGLESGRFDVAVGALTVTADREAKVDFSYPFYTTGLAIAVPATNAGVVSIFKRFFSWRFFTALGGLVALLLAVGAGVWLFERRRNSDEFGGSVVHGLGSGLWWAAVTMTTVGYGDKAPRTLGGRLVGLVWMFAAIILISGFTAAIATSLTVGQLSSNIKGVGDLANAKVATVAHSAAASALNERGIGFSAQPRLKSAIDALAAGKIDAVVYDAPLLRYRVRKRDNAKLMVLANTFERQDYAFALPQGSDLREPINRAILEYLQTPAWSGLLNQYLGRP